MMFTFSNSSKTGAFTTLAGMALLGLTLVVPATAQDRPMNNSNMSMRNSDNRMNDMDMDDPAPLTYPIAPAGGLDLYHYRTYRENVLSPGSVTEKRMEQERMRDMRMHRETRFTDDETMADPAPWDYPVAIPGGLDMYHYKTYRSNVLVPGSVTEARWEKEHMRDMKLRSETHFTDDETMADPAPMTYPIAPAGGLDLYHYRTYRENVLSPGSVTEKREQIERRRDAKRKKDSMNANPSNGSNQ